MLYYRCPSCKTNLAKKELQLEKKLVDLKHSKRSRGDIKKIFEELGIINSCCTMRALTYVDTIKLIK
jgi:DNA-directed RNA polymerase subunit N (RpoN/RPB10)